MSVRGVLPPKTLSLRLPGDLHKLVAERATAAHRSVHGQILYMLETWAEPGTAQTQTNQPTKPVIRIASSGLPLHETFPRRTITKIKKDGRVLEDYAIDPARDGVKHPDQPYLAYEGRVYERTPFNQQLDQFNNVLTSPTPVWTTVESHDAWYDLHFLSRPHAKVHAEDHKLGETVLVGTAQHLWEKHLAAFANTLDEAEAIAGAQRTWGELPVQELTI